jgi:hypothetical protein
VFCISSEFPPSLLPSSLANRQSVLCLLVCPYVASCYLLIHSIIQPTTGYFCIVVSVLKSLKLNGRQQSVALQAFRWMDCFESNQTEGRPSATYQQVTRFLLLLFCSALDMRHMDLCFTKGQITEDRRINRIPMTPHSKVFSSTDYNRNKKYRTTKMIYTDRYISV